MNKNSALEYFAATSDVYLDASQGNKLEYINKYDVHAGHYYFQFIM